MTASHRERLSRARGARLAAGTVSVAHPTKWANPFRPATRTTEANLDAVQRYRRYLDERPDLVEAARNELAGKNLACWCAPELDCHADVLLDLVSGRSAAGT